MDATGIGLLLIISAPLALTFLLRLVPTAWGVRLAVVLLLGQLASFTWLGTAAIEPTVSLPWIGAWDVRLAFRLDPLARIFSQLACAIGALVFAYAGGYMPHEHHKHGSHRPLRVFFQLLLFFVFSMLGVVCADDLLTLYVFWELVTVASFLLIAYHLREEEARAAALHSLTITGGSGLFFFVSLVVLLLEGGSSSIHELLSRPAGWFASSPLAPLFAFGLLFTAFAKSVQIPFYGWLPDAMAAPTPVSALLHSATLVATGVFLLARFFPLLFALPIFEPALVVVGAATALVSGGIALARTRMKEMLAWSTVSYHGQAVLLLGLGAERAAIYFIAFHAVSKAGLFLVAGSLSYTTGADDIRQLGGLWRTHPILMVLTGILALGLAGFPFTAGFWMKELLFHEVFAKGGDGIVATAMAIAILSVAYLTRFFWSIFLSRPHEAPSRPEGVPSAILLAPATLAVLFLVAGLWPGLGARLANPLPADALELEVPWPWPPYVYAGVFCLPIGLVAFGWMQTRWNRLGVWVPGVVISPTDAVRMASRAVGPTRLFFGFLVLLERLGEWSSRLQTGRLVHYVCFLILVPVVAGIVFLPQVGGLPEPPPVDDRSPGVAFVALTTAIATLAIASIVVRRHVSAIIVVGGVGFLLSLLFALLRAPDIAFVQMVVETGTALLLLAALGRIPNRLRAHLRRPEARRGRAATWAIVLGSSFLGVLLGLALFAVLRYPTDPTLGRSFYALSEREGVEAVVKGILADFRAMDTFGEVAVFAASVLGAVLLLGKRAERRPPEPSEEEESREER